MILKDNGKGQVTYRNKQTKEYFLHWKQLNAFDHPYHIHKYLDSEPSTFLLVDRYIIFNKSVKRIQLHMIMIYTDAAPTNGYMPDLNNGPGVTRIVPTFWRQHFSNWTRIMAPPQAIPILGQMEDTPVQVSYLWFPGGYYICPRAAGLNSIMAWGDSNSGPVLAPGVYLSPTRITAPSGHSNLVSDEVYIYCSSLLFMISWWLHSDVSKQIRPWCTCTKHMLTSLGESTQ